MIERERAYVEKRTVEDEISSGDRILEKDSEVRSNKRYRGSIIEEGKGIFRLAVSMYVCSSLLE